jgi:hypothetical protein
MNVNKPVIFIRDNAAAKLLQAFAFTENVNCVQMRIVFHQTEKLLFDYKINPRIRKTEPDATDECSGKYNVPNRTQPDYQYVARTFQKFNLMRQM